MGLRERIFGQTVEEAKESHREERERQLHEKQKQDMKRRLALLQTELDVLRRVSE